ncbi:hypothetical protein CVT24_010255 [Panaeolus cyanescens]|uniref:Uncharacterized protein n=1 Tax=Panaeolus cyanescens TaxID=181874 RepID=A0A409YPY8_9AGAR|nr:hypothetical protein CVT24_010255 [Panaeolus cyanescens]
MPHKKAKRSIREKTRQEQGSDLAPQKSSASLQNEPIPKSAHRILNAMAIREEFKKKRKAGEELEGGGGKRRKGDGNNTGKPSGAKDGKKQESKLRIMPGESIQHFNKRVEDDLRPLVKTAVQASRAAVRNAVKEEKEAKAQAKAEREKAAKAKGKSKSTTGNDSDTDSDSPSSRKPSKRRRSSSPPPHLKSNAVDKHASKPKEFATLSSSAPKRLNDIAQAPPEFKKLPRGATKDRLAGAGKGGAEGTAKSDGVVSMSMKLMMEKEREKAIQRYRELKATRLKKEGREDNSLAREED